MANVKGPRVVLQSRSGLQGFSSCCAAAVTFMDAGAGADMVLCCKACYHAVETVAVAADDDARFDAIITAFIREEATYRETLAALAALPSSGLVVPTVGYRIRFRQEG
jgi:hypothetical protein